MRDRSSPFDRRADLALVILLTLAAGILFARDATVGGVRWKDESTHVMDGVLLLDWLAAGPAAWRDPLDFAARQYAHYPNLGFLGAFPPGLALVEAPFFAIFGVSLVTARLLIALFGMSAAAGAYLLARRFCDRTTAGLATVFLITMPVTVTWSRQVMLEMPTLAATIWLLYAACRYFDRPTWRGLSIVALLAFAAPLFKQNGLTALPVIAMLALCHALRGRVPVIQLLAGALLLTLPQAGYMLAVAKIQGQGQILDRVFNADTPIATWLAWPELTAYARSVPEQAGWFVTGLACVGLLIALARWDWRWTMTLLLFGSAYALVTAMQHKEPRYLFLGYLPIALWAGLAGGTLLRELHRPVRRTLAVVVALTMMAFGYRTPIDYRPDFAPLVGTYAAQMRSGLVFVEADRDTCFVLAARERLGPQATMVVRGSKTLYSCSCNLDWDFASYVATRDDVSRLLNHFCFDMIFVERGNPNNLREVDLLRAALNDPDRYTHIATHTLHVPAPHAAPSITFDVYRPRIALARRAREIEIPVPLARRTIRVQLGVQ